MYCDFSKYSESDFIAAGLTKISSDPFVYGELRPKKTTVAQTSMPVKKLELTY